VHRALPSINAAGAAHSLQLRACGDKSFALVVTGLKPRCE